MSVLDTDALAARLEAAWSERRPVEPLTADAGLADVVDAYRIQAAWSRLREADGDRIVGRKIGLTSTAVQEQLGVDEPDYGSLWASRHVSVSGGRGEVDRDWFIQPRVEGELAFLLGDPPPGPDVTVAQVLAATEAVAPAIEVVDSRIADWRITLPDTVADNASFGAFAIGPWSRTLPQEDLRTVGMLLSRDGEPAVSGVGAAALGHPARAVAWLLTKLHGFGIAAQPGDIVLSGALGPMIDVGAAMDVTVQVHGQAPLRLRIG